jgi:hypothetical protein
MKKLDKKLQKDKEETAKYNKKHLFLNKLSFKLNL